MSAHDEKEHEFVIRDDEHSLTFDDLKTIKELTRMYQAGKAFTLVAVSFCTIGGTIIALAQYFKGH